MGLERGRGLPGWVTRLRVYFLSAFNIRLLGFRTSALTVRPQFRDGGKGLCDSRRFDLRSHK